MKHPIRRRLIYLGFQGLRVLVQALPLRAGRAVGHVLGRVAYGLLRAQRRLALEHLAFAFGDSLTPSQQRQIARGVFRNLGQNAVEWLQLPKFGVAELQRLVVSDGVEHVRRALAQGHGAIMLTAHFGNWELIAPYLIALGFEGGVLARHLRYSEYESFLISLRGRKGVPTFVRGSVKDVARILRANQLLGVLPDQDISSLEGVFVNFFGSPAYTPVGPAALSLMTGAPILPCFIVREGEGFRLTIEPPVAAPRAVDRAQALTQLTQAWSDVVESYIQRHPDHWVWMHRRWKTQPAVSSQQTAASQTPEPCKGLVKPHSQPAVLLGCLLLTASCLLLTSGCAKPMAPSATGTAATEAPADESADQRMSGFTLTGYATDGTKRWELEGTGASVEDNIVTIRRPDGVGYDPTRTSYLTASLARVNQANRHVRLEHDVTIHTSDGLWFSAPVLHWIPDQDQMATDQPVRIETDHMLLRGRGASGFTQLKQTTIFEDIELVLNPSDEEAPGTGAKHVTITCDGPLTFDYEHNIATFEQHVHVKDPNGDLYSDKLIAYLDQPTHTIRYAEAIGRVRIHQNQNTAQSDRAVYEPSIGKITLVGKPSLLVYPSEDGQGTQLSFGGLSGQAVKAATE